MRRLRKITRNRVPVADVQIEKIDPNNPVMSLIERAIAALESGGVVVAPTETRYGLLARADKQMPTGRFLAIKPRSAGKPVAVFVGTVEMMMHYAEMNPIAQLLARVFLPGPLTVVVPAIGSWDRMIVPNRTIGIRVSSSPVIQAIMERVDFPVTATSANLPGDDDNSDVASIAATLGDRVDLYLDGGVLLGAPSTVVDCSQDEPVILRQGAIAADQILSAMKAV